MATVEQELDAFTRFAKDRIGKDARLTIDELYDEWRTLNPPPNDALAIRASLRDLEADEKGRSFEEFANEFRQGNHISRAE